MRGAITGGASALVIALAIWLLATGSSATGDPYDLNDPPDCSNVVASPSAVKPGAFTLVRLSGATDPDGDALTYSVDRVFQDEPTGPTLDAKSGPTAGSVYVRWESDPKGTGRFYTIYFTVSDGQDTCTGTTTVVVSSPRKKGSALVNEGALFDSFTGAPA